MNCDFWIKSGEGGRIQNYIKYGYTHRHTLYINTSTHITLTMDIVIIDELTDT